MARGAAWLAVAWLAAALLADAAATGERVAAERSEERPLAVAGGLYLVLATDPPALEVKSRGVRLESVPLDGIALLQRRPVLGPRSEAIALPAVWTVAEQSAVSPPRRLIAPSELREVPAGGMESVGAGVAVAEEADPPPPAEYSLALDGGWELRVARTLPSTSWLARGAAALADGARSLGGGGDEAPLGAIVLAADPDDAQRVHHLFRSGTRILIVPPDPPS